MNKKIAIIGSGALSTALAKILIDGNQQNVVVYGIDEQEIKELSEGKNTKYFPETVKIPPLNTTNDLNKALASAEYIVLAVPSKIMDVVVTKIASAINSDALIINGSKGFYPNSELSLHEGIQKTFAKNNFIRAVVSLIGPSHAEEMIISMPTAVSAVSEKKEHCLEVQKLFSNSYFRVYAQTDVKGATACSAFKNVLAIAAGAVAGLGYGINSAAALLTRGLVEMARFVEIVGGQTSTVMGLTGVGDLIVTATSDLSRNYSTGKIIATKGIDAIPQNLTVEGLEALKYIYQICKGANAEMPIIYFMYEVIISKTKKLNDFVKELWARELKAE